MRKSIFLAVIAFATYACQTTTNTTSEGNSVPQHKLSVAYFRDGSVNYYVGDSSNVKTLPNVSNPDLSSDGTELAYTESYDPGNKKTIGDRRRIGILDIRTGAKRTIKSKSPQCYGPVWSPDGNQLAFNVFDQDHWGIGVADPSGNYKLLRPSTKTDYYGITWTSDSKTVLMHDFTTLFFVDLANRVTQQLPLKEVTQGKDVSSATKFTLTPDGQFLLFNATNLEASLCTEKDEPVNATDALYVYDIQKKKLSKITSNAMYCGDYTLAGRTIYFTATVKCGLKQPSIYVCDLSGKNVKEFLANATDITLAR